MAKDALDPGAAGDYPNWPRRPDGKPAGVGHQVTTEGERQAEERMPTGIRRQGGRLIDLTPRHQDGTPIVPPDLPPDQ